MISKLKDKYIMTCDLHTHTIYSHGIGTIEENVAAARKRGLSVIGITDHGLDHLLYGIKRKKLPEMRRIVDEQNAKYDDIEVLLGVEANITSSPEGFIGLNDDDASYMDYLIAGYHFGGKGEDFFRTARHHIGNLLAGKNCKRTCKIYAKNTANTIAAIRANKLKVLTHPHDKINEDFIEIARECERAGTFMEINSSHLSMREDELKNVAESTRVQFIISSDAHSPERVGEFVPALELAISAGLDVGRIVNIKEI